MKGFLEFVPGDSFLHRMNPIAKLASAFLIVAGCFVTDGFVLLACVLVLDAVLSARCKMTRQALGLAKVVAAFSLLLALIALLFSPSGDVLVALPWGYIGTGSVVSALLIVVRLVACATAVLGVLCHEAHRYGECAGEGVPRALSIRVRVRVDGSLHPCFPERHAGGHGGSSRAWRRV